MAVKLFVCMCRESLFDIDFAHLSFHRLIQQRLQNKALKYIVSLISSHVDIRDMFSSTFRGNPHICSTKLDYT